MGEPDLHVALLSPCYWPEVRRGSERFIHELAAGLLRSGQRPTLITSHPGLPTRRVEDGVRVLRFPRLPQGPLDRRNFEAYLTHVPPSYLALRAGSYDIAHAVYPTDGLAAVRWQRRTGRPALLSYMGVPDPQWLRAQRLRLPIMRRVVAGADAVVVLSEHAAAAFRRSFEHEPHVIAPGVDLGTFRPGPARASKPTILCAAAADVARKNVPLLVDAFAALRRRLPEAQLVLSRPRDPTRAPALAAQLTRPGVQWRDLDDRTVLAQACAEAWVAVLPSIDEAFGLVLAEALACGTPVVGYGGGAVPEIVDSEAIGRLFHRVGCAELERALREALELTHRPGTAAACRARAELFSSERCTARYLELYRTLISSRRQLA